MVALFYRTSGFYGLEPEDGSMFPTQVAQQLPILVAQLLAIGWRYDTAVFSS